MFSLFKKSSQVNAAISIFEEDLKEAKSMPLAMQIMVSRAVYEEMNQSMKNPDARKIRLQALSSKLPQSLVERVFKRRLKIGVDFSQPESGICEYLQNSLTLAWLGADLSEDLVANSAITKPLIDWLRQMKPHIDY